MLGTGIINTHGIVSDLDLVFQTPSALSPVLNAQGQNITINLAPGGGTNTGQIGVGYNSTGSLLIKNGTTVNSQAGYLGYNAGSTGSGTVTGAGSQWNLSDGASYYDLNVGYRGTGTSEYPQRRRRQQQQRLYRRRHHLH